VNWTSAQHKEVYAPCSLNYHLHLGLKPINSLYLNPSLKAGDGINNLKIYIHQGYMVDSPPKVVTGEADHPTSGFSLRFKGGAPIWLQPSTGKHMHHVETPITFIWG